MLAIPGLVAPGFGLLVDRVRKRPLMIAADLGIALVLAALLLVHDRSDVWIVYVVTLLYGASGFLFTSAQSALLTPDAAEERLADANAVLQTASEGSRLIAPLIGAGLFAAVGGAAVAALDAATFLASAVCLAGLGSASRVRSPRAPHPDAARGGHRAHRPPAGSAPDRAHGGRGALVVGFAETAIFAVLQQGIHRPPAFLGVLSAAQGVGAIAAPWPRPR